LENRNWGGGGQRHGQEREEFLGKDNSHRHGGGVGQGDDGGGGGHGESHKPPPLGDANSILPAHRGGHQNASKVGVFCIVVLLIVALAAAGAIRSESRWRCPVASRVAHSTLGDALHIAPAHHYGNQNGRRTR